MTGAVVSLLVRNSNFHKQNKRSLIRFSLQKEMPETCYLVDTKLNTNQDHGEQHQFQQRISFFGRKHAHLMEINSKVVDALQMYTNLMKELPMYGYSGLPKANVAQPHFGQPAMPPQPQVSFPQALTHNETKPMPLKLFLNLVASQFISLIVQVKQNQRIFFFF